MSENTKSGAVSPETALVVKMFHGLSPYEPVWHAMQTFTDRRGPDTLDEIWLLQHPSVFTQGQAGKAEHVLAPGDIPVIQVDRGGQVTYHGPGQLVLYLMLDIERLGIGARELVSRIEQSIIRTLRCYALQAEARQDAPGVYVDGKKIASIGLRIRKGKSFHGLSLNVDMDMEPFQRINPCGYSELEMAQLADYPDTEPMEPVAGRLISVIQEAFGYDSIQMDYCESMQN